MYITYVRLLESQLCRYNIYIQGLTGTLLTKGIEFEQRKYIQQKGLDFISACCTTFA